MAAMLSSLVTPHALLHHQQPQATNNLKSLGLSSKLIGKQVVVGVVGSRAASRRIIESRISCSLNGESLGSLVSESSPTSCPGEFDESCGKSHGGGDDVEENSWKDGSRLWGGRMLAILFTALQAVAPIPFDGSQAQWIAGSAEAVLYSPDTKVPRSAEVALRRAIPAVNTSMKKMQESLEDIFYLLRIPQRKPYGEIVRNNSFILQ